MALLTIVVAVSLPSLKGFFRGRSLDSEARRFLTLTRYGQSRAISEGFPTVLWIDSKKGSYGLQLQPGYTDQDEKSVEYTLDDGLEIEARLPLSSGTNRVQMVIQGLGNVPMIRFMPDGSIGPSSPDAITFRQAEAEPVVIGESTNCLSYAIQTNNPTLANRR